MSDTERLAQRIRLEYQSAPTLKLTVAQVSRQWSASEGDCLAALSTLVSEGVLWLAPSGCYVALPTPEGVTVKGDLSAARCPHCQKRNSFQRSQTIQGKEVTVTVRCVGCGRVFNLNTPAA
jgi:hypothetical protein